MIRVARNHGKNPRSRRGAFLSSLGSWTTLQPMVGIFAVCLIAVELNVLAARFDSRWDLTPDRRYTPAPVTQSVLKGLDREVSVVVLLARTDPLTPAVQTLLEGYSALSHQLKVEWLDPDRDPARFLARQAALGIQVGASQEGKVLSDSIIVLVSGTRRAYITTDDVALVDAQTGETESRLEQALTRGLRNLEDDSRPNICFAAGHREVELEDRAPSGLSELRRRITEDDAEATRVELTDLDKLDLSGCRVLAVASPELPWTDATIERVLAAAEKGTNLWLMGGTIPDKNGRVRSTRLDQVARVAGIQMGTDLVVETDAGRRLPGLGAEVFLSQPDEHPITSGLTRVQVAHRLEVLVSMAQSLKAIPGSKALPLLKTESTARALTVVSDADLGVANAATDAGTRSFAVAMASEVATAPGKPTWRLVVSPIGVVENRALESDTLVGNRVFTDSVLAWLAHRPSGKVEILRPLRRSLAFELSEADLGRIIRYVTLVVPLSVAGLGFGLMWRRRRNSRRTQRPEGHSKP